MERIKRVSELEVFEAINQLIDDNKNVIVRFSRDLFSIMHILKKKITLENVDFSFVIFGKYRKYGRN